MRTKSKLVRQKPPADFEEVKRRFIRQNRELAKNNSNQSLRIRNLELEVSRLLADNLELRNEVLHLQNEVFTSQTRASNTAARKVKEELQAKIAELSVIVDGIEDVQNDLQDTPREKKPTEGNWRERQPLTELMRDSQMPTIVEDKLYPRRTLGAEEMQAIRLSDHSSNESPDLGPPPVAHFDYEDPVKSASPLVSKTSPPELPTASEEDVLAAGLSVNLETRRKRRDGHSRLEIRRHSLLPQEPAKADGDSSSILRTGAKRKLADRENDKPIKPPSKGDFTFRQKTVGEDAKINEKSKSAMVDAEETIQIASPKPVRKILGEKSVNMSPKKAASKMEKPVKEGNEKSAAPKFRDGKEAGSIGRRKASSIPVTSPPREIVDTVEIPPPEHGNNAETGLKTPAALDLFSPTPSEPSAKPEGRGDTPPPSDLSSLSITTDGGTRPSRRARAAVSYAEPSLILKMRRPDKKMVDAISGLQDPRRAMSVSTERKLSSGMVSIKKEPVDEEESWKDLPSATIVEAASPLDQKGSAGVTEAFPIEAPVVSDAVRTDDKPSASSATISALMAGSRKRRQSSQQPLGTDIEATTKKLEELDLYEFKESSSPLTDGSSGGKADRPSAVKSHRRHSSVPKNIKPTEETLGTDARLSAVPGRSERAASRRRSMML